MWRKILSILLVLSLMFSSGSCVSSAPTPQPNTETIRYIETQRNVSHLINSTVAFVATRDDGRMNPFCSGFFVNQNIIVSAAHCFERRPIPQFPQLSIPAREGQLFAFRTYDQFRNANNNMTGPTNVAAIVSVDSVSDLAVLRTETTSANFLTLSRQVPELGSMVYTVGHPGGIPWFLTQGTVGTIFRLSTNRVEGVMCNITIYYGSSGGPLVNNNGEVVGVIGAMINRNSGMALAYPTENIVTIYPSLNSAQTL